MRHHGHTAAPPPPRSAEHSDWRTLQSLLPYLWAYKTRVVFALAFMVLAKVSNIGVPLLLKQIIDQLTPNLTTTQMAAAVPLGLLLAYGLLRLCTTIFTEAREMLFARVTQSAVRKIALQVFQHLHALSLRFHLERQTGGLTRDIERGTRGISSLISYTLYSILPTLIEIGLVIGLLAVQYDTSFALIAGVALVGYIIFTVKVTEWRTHFRRTMNELDSKANTKAIDSLLNYETVKYFNNEHFEAKRYDQSLGKWEQAAVRSQTSLSLLNMGQSAIIAVAVTLMVWRATVGVTTGVMTLGDLVLINALMIQLYIPLNFLGVIYREIKQSLTDIDRMFTLLQQHQEIQDAPHASPLQHQGAAIQFDHVSFSYDGQRPILQDISFTIPAGHTVAVVGESGSGKSTLGRLLYRFYDIQQGSVRIDGQDTRHVTQHSLRQAIGIVPQDAVLFNDTIAYNIAYGKPDATQADIERVAQAAYIGGLIEKLPGGYQTQVGERGLKLSGGEKQRVAIARTILKDPAILIFDEATSALDSLSEQIIQNAIAELSQAKTTLIIAHRLSTIVHADSIIVMHQGRIIEQGNHETLLQQQGRYAQMWVMQQAEQSSAS